MKSSRPAGKMIVNMAVRIPMRDGIELVADVYRPAKDGKSPVVLLRCPYDRTDPEMGQMRIVDPAWLARQGFCVVVQDTRGCGESEGDIDLVYQEVDDGYDTVEWAAAQLWSTGAVGIYGSSYMGTTTYQATASHAPHLKAAVALCRRYPEGGPTPYGRSVRCHLRDMVCIPDQADDGVTVAYGSDTKI